MISIVHANDECKGSMLQVDMKPPEGTDEGVFNLCITAQTEVGSYNPDGTKSYAEFDGEEAFINLNANQTTRLLFVLEGNVDSINGGKGLFENGDTYTSILHCDRLKEKPYGFALHIITKLYSNKAQNGRIILNPTEAELLVKVLNGAIDRVAFGD